jgi:hypothetical protein
LSLGVTQLNVPGLSDHEPAAFSSSNSQTIRFSRYASKQRSVTHYEAVLLTSLCGAERGVTTSLVLYRAVPSSRPADTPSAASTASLPLDALLHEMLTRARITRCVKRSCHHPCLGGRSNCQKPITWTSAIEDSNCTCVRPYLRTLITDETRFRRRNRCWGRSNLRRLVSLLRRPVRFAMPQFRARRDRQNIRGLETLSVSMQTAHRHRLRAVGSLNSTRSWLGTAGRRASCGNSWQKIQLDGLWRYRVQPDVEHATTAANGVRHNADHSRRMLVSGFRLTTDSM